MSRKIILIIISIFVFTVVSAKVVFALGTGLGDIFPDTRPPGEPDRPVELFFCSCGDANGQWFDDAPSVGLCKKSTPSKVTYDFLDWGSDGQNAFWKWKCTCPSSTFVLNPNPPKDLILECSALVNPRCGVNNGLEFDDNDKYEEMKEKIKDVYWGGNKDEVKPFCDRGLMSGSNFVSNDYGAWSCIMNGKRIFCFFSLKTGDDPKCGKVSGEKKYKEEIDNISYDSGLCDFGYPVELTKTDDGGLTWRCKKGDKYSEQCIIIRKPREPKCGNLHDKKIDEEQWTTYSDYNKNSNKALCELGSGADFLAKKPVISWRCENEGLTVDCSASIKAIDGECNSYIHNKSLDDQPQSGICSKGISDAFEDKINLWAWKCKGLYGGKDVDCWSYKKKLDAMCGSDVHDKFFYYRPQSRFCDLGTPDAFGEKPNLWAWKCKGKNGGRDVTCWSFKKKSNDNKLLEFTDYNQKKVELYSEKSVFIIPNNNDDSRSWVDTLPLVPVSTWTEVDANNKAQIKKYPVLSYWKKKFIHPEDSSRNHYRYDPDSLILFLRQYGADSVYFVNYREKDGQIPEDLPMANLLSAKPPLGAGIDTIINISPTDYFSFWEKYSSVVICEDNYELALYASNFASLINAPLIIRGSKLDDSKYYDGKSLVCVGNVGVDCSENFQSKQSIQDASAELINLIDGKYSDKIIAVNPGDYNFNIKVEDSNFRTLYSEKSGHVISTVYGRQSLMAPFLASAKHELLVSNSQFPESNSCEIEVGYCNNLVREINSNIDRFPFSDSKNYVAKNHIVYYNGENVKRIMHPQSVHVGLRNNELYYLSFKSIIKKNIESGEVKVVYSTTDSIRRARLFGNQLIIIKYIASDMHDVKFAKMNTIISLNINSGIVTKLYESSRYIDQVYYADGLIAWISVVHNNYHESYISVMDISSSKIYESGNTKIGDIMSINDNTVFTVSKIYNYKTNQMSDSKFPYKSGRDYFVAFNGKVYYHGIQDGVNNLIEFDLSKFAVTAITKSPGLEPLSMLVSEGKIYIQYKLNASIYIYDIATRHFDEISYQPRGKATNFVSDSNILLWNEEFPGIDASLTIIGDPYAIPYIYSNNVFGAGYLNAKSADMDIYGSQFNSVGRLTGYTISDLSTFIARSIFYDEIIPDGSVQKVSLYASVPNGIREGVKFLSHACPIFDKDSEFELDTCAPSEYDSYTDVYGKCVIRLMCDLDSEFQKKCDNNEAGSGCGVYKCYNATCDWNIKDFQTVISRYLTGKYIPGNPVSLEEYYSDRIIGLVKPSQYQPWEVGRELERFEAEGWKDASHVYFMDHASHRVANIDGGYVPELKNAFVNINGCSGAEITPDTWDPGHLKTSSIALSSIRNGAAHYRGAVAIGSGEGFHTPTFNLENGVYYDKLSIGEANMIEDYNLNLWEKSSRFGNQPFTLLGDPIIVLKGKIDAPLFPF